jgi:hypothetical protein
MPQKFRQDFFGEPGIRDHFPCYVQGIVHRFQDPEKGETSYGTGRVLNGNDFYHNFSSYS